MSLYSEYLKERENVETIEDQYGFLTYKIVEKTIWMYDCFVKKDNRRDSKARRYYDKVFNIALDNNCTNMYTTVFMSTNGWEISLASLIKEGFKIVHQNKDEILLKIGIKEKRNG